MDPMTLARAAHRKSDLSEIATLDYEYDRVGNPTKITREDGSATYYEYDRIYQLTGETQVGSGVEYAFEYDYDGAHNRTLKVVDGVATYYTYNEANQLVTETTDGETTYYHYDGCGNTVAKQEPSGTTYYQYNTENLMTRIDFATGSSYYEYDADSKRVSQRTAEGFRQFVYQGPDMLKLQLERDESEETVAHYTIGSGLEAMRREASSFYHYNHLGTTLALTGADEAVTDAYRHDAWGVLLERTGSTVNPHTYVGRERYYRMSEAAMYHLGFRDYAQGVGRFTTVDPLRRLKAPSPLGYQPGVPSNGPSSGRVPPRWDLQAVASRASGFQGHPFQYVRNLPSALVDPRGLVSCDDCLIWYKECMDDVVMADAQCEAECAWSAGVPAGIAAVIACGLMESFPHPITIALCLGITVGDAIGLIMCMAQCEQQRELLEDSCWDAYQLCNCRCE